MNYQSRKITTNQDGPHEKLYELLHRHQENSFKKPITAYNQSAFEKADALLKSIDKPLILDSGCGTGESTIQLAERHPEAFILGIDKSALRLEKGATVFQEQSARHAFIRADIFDFWRLAAAANWQVEKHYLLYPNPWPKKQHLQRRYHGHAAFFDLIQLGKRFELRSNWHLYLQEFSQAFEFATGVQSQVSPFEPDRPLTNFETKYSASGQTLFQLCIQTNQA